MNERPLDNAQTSFTFMESEDYLKRQIITYLGNKRALLPFLGRSIEKVRQRIGRTTLRLADLFSGSGIVSRYFKQYASSLLVNDLESYAYVISRCFLTNKTHVNWDELTDWHVQLQNRIEQEWAPGPITEAYAPVDESCITAQDRVFYTRRNAIFLDTARRVVGDIPEQIQCLFLAPLLAEATIHSNTSGVFKGFYKDRNGLGCYGGAGRNALQRILGEVQLQLPFLSNFECPATIYQEDTNTLVEHMPEVDLAYLDPPYNQHPYGSNYFMLNLLVSGGKPRDLSRVSGIPAGWNRSRYNKRREVEEALFGVIQQCPARFLLISYNSEGFISYSQFCDRLIKFGKLTTDVIPYNTFRGCRNLSARAQKVTEFLFLLEKA